MKLTNHIIITEKGKEQIGRNTKCQNVWITNPY